MVLLQTTPYVHVRELICLFEGLVTFDACQFAFRIFIMKRLQEPLPRPPWHGSTNLCKQGLWLMNVSDLDE